MNIKKLKCPNCGKPLDFKDGNDEATCKSCGITTCLFEDEKGKTKIKIKQEDKSDKIKKFVVIGLLVGFVLLLILGKDGSMLFGRKKKDPTLLTGLHHVEIDIKDYGVISLELDADTAPISVTNFIKLASIGYYDGTRFHRIMQGFMMQGGQGAPTDTIKGEFASNGITNNISHKRGVISMARADDKNSATSQFFIVQQDSTFLDGKYAAFGYVTNGMEVVDKVCNESKPIDDNGTIETDKMPIINTIRVLD